MADPHLPTDVLVEVLIRLPVKSIVKFRCVAKTWRDLISRSLFVQRHLKYDRRHKSLLVKRGLPPQDRNVETPHDSVDNDETPLSVDTISDFSFGVDLQFIFTKLQTRVDEIFSFHDQDFPQVLVSPNLSIPFLEKSMFPFLNEDIPIHGPCNGLVCIAEKQTVFFCNPALREFKLLPPRKFPSVNPLESGFGFDPISGAYKFIQVSELSHEVASPYEEVLSDTVLFGTVIDLYDSASNSWKQIHDSKVPCYVYWSDVFFNGVIHWCPTIPSEDYPCILCFDIRTESFGQLDFVDSFFPPEMALSLLVLDECLSMVRYSKSMKEPQEIEIWVMNEYGMKESWTKQFVIGPYCVIRPLLFLKNDWLLVESDNDQLAACALHENQFKEFQFFGHGRTLSAVVYEESMISLDDVIISKCFQNE